MKITYSQLINPVFQRALNNLADHRFPSVKLNLTVMHLVRNLREHLAAYSKSRLALLEKYGQRGPNDTFSLPAQKASVFSAEMKPLDETEVDVDWKPIPIPENLPLSANDLDQLVGTVFEEEKPAPDAV